MAGRIAVNQLQLGDSATASQNFHLQTNVDGTLSLNRGNVGASLGQVFTVDTAGNILATNPNGVVGYGVGAGGTVTQATSKATAVTLNRPFGQIICNGASLAANTTVSFTVNNSVYQNNDIVHCMIVGGTTTGGNYIVTASSTGAGAFTINIRNITAGALAEGLIIHFAIIRGATS